MRLLLGLSFSCVAGIAYSEPSICGTYVRKRQSSDQTRFLYISGVLGSGVRTFMNTLYEVCQPDTCVRPSFTSLSLLFDSSNNTFANGTLKDIRPYREAVIATFQTYAEEYVNKLILLSEVGLFPDSVSTTAAFDQPNLQVLAALAETAGVDLRIALIFRSTHGILRTLGPIRGLAADILADSAAVLTAQLQLIDKSFVVPVSLNNSSAGVWQLLHPKLRRRKSKLHKRLNGFADEPRQSVDAFEDHVRPMIDVILHKSINGAPAYNGTFVKKTVFSKTRRFLFIAGLEGTGHHTMGLIFEHCPSSLCQVNEKLTKLLYTGASSPNGIFVYPNDKSAAAITTRRKEFLDTLRGALRKKRAPGLTVLNSLPFNKTGEMSFPNFRGNTKIFNHVNVYKLASLAEEASIDLRIIVLRRSADEILTSTTKHRHFGNRHHEATVLTNNAAAMAAELQLLDSKFLLCVPHASVGSIDFWEKLVPRQLPRPLSFELSSSLTKEARAHWLHPGLSKDIFMPMLAAVQEYGTSQRRSERTDDCKDCTDEPLEMNSSYFVYRREANIAQLESVAQYLYRAAGCSCDDALVVNSAEKSEIV